MFFSLVGVALRSVNHSKVADVCLNSIPQWKGMQTLHLQEFSVIRNRSCYPTCTEKRRKKKRMQNGPLQPARSGLFYLTSAGFPFITSPVPQQNNNNSHKQILTTDCSSWGEGLGDNTHYSSAFHLGANTTPSISRKLLPELHLQTKKYFQLL